MDYQIVLPKTVKASDFAKNWNASSDCRAVAAARIEQGAVKSFDPLADAAMTVLSTVSMGIAANALYDLIKQVLVKQGVRKQTEIVQYEQPDGTKMLVVKIIEE